MSKNNEISTNPYKGVRDFFPEDMNIQKKIIGDQKKGKFHPKAFGGALGRVPSEQR
jgi:hypothetical protein